MPSGSCFLCQAITPDSIVHMGFKSMAVKDIESEMASGSVFGMKLREIAKKVEALD